MTCRTVTAEEFEQARARVGWPRRRSPQVERVLELAVNECCAFPCDPKAHRSYKKWGSRCNLQDRILREGRHVGRTLETAHAGDELLVRRVEEAINALPDA